jgi:hypothetical protein
MSIEGMAAMVMKISPEMKIIALITNPAPSPQDRKSTAPWAGNRITDVQECQRSLTACGEGETLSLAGETEQARASARIDAPIIH